MTRLYRPSIPVEVKCRVALRQLGEMFIDNVIEIWRMKPGDAYLKGLGVRVPRLGLGRLLAVKLEQLAELLGCTVQDLRLDHDPALENRMKLIREWTGKTSRTVWVMVVPEGAQVIRYDPDANDPDSFLYRPHGAQFDGSHDVKTRIRGDRGQFADNVLAKRERRRLKKKTPPPNAKIAKTWNLHPCMTCGRIHAKGKCQAPKRKLQSRPFPKREKKRDHPRS